jgi:hypothetical protein
MYWKIHICRVRGKPTFKIRPEPYRLLARHPRIDAWAARWRAGSAPGADIGSGDFELTFVILCVSMVYLLSLTHKEILIMLPQHFLLCCILLLYVWLQVIWVQHVISMETTHGFVLFLCHTEIVNQICCLLFYISIPWLVYEPFGMMVGLSYWIDKSRYVDQGLFWFWKVETFQQFSVLILKCDGKK